MAAEDSLPRIWLIDDTSHWHRVTAATLDAWRPADFRSFHSGHAGLMAFAHCQPDQRPHIVLMDFFIGGERGDAVTRELLQLSGGAPPLIVGYSTASSGSQQIVQAGAQTAVAKHANAQGINPSLLRWLRER